MPRSSLSQNSQAISASWSSRAFWSWVSPCKHLKPNWKQHPSDSLCMVALWLHCRQTQWHYHTHKFQFHYSFRLCQARVWKKKNSSREWLSCATSTYPNHVYSNHSNNINIVMRSCTHILDRFTMIYISVILQCKYCIGRNCLLGTTPSRTLGITKTCTGAWWWQNRSPFLCEHWTHLLQMLL